MKTTVLRLVAGAVAVWLGVAAARAQEPDPCDEACHARRGAMWEQAEQLQAQSRHEEAAQRYLQILDERPLSTKAMQAGVRAARCLRRLERPVEAMACYDRVIAAARATLAARGEEVLDVSTFWRGTATIEKAGMRNLAGEYQAAANLCRDLVTEFVPAARPIVGMPTPAAVVGQQAAVHAARCLAELHQYPEAIALCDTALAIAEAKRHKKQHKGQGINEQACEALLVKAEVCAKADRPDEARQAIQQLKTQYAFSPQATRVKILEAQLNGTPLQAAEGEWDRERAASELLAEANRQEDGGFWESALPLFD